MPYSTAELDTIRLCVALEAINGIANHAMLDVPRIIEPGTEIEVRYKSRQHQHLFLIRLLDFAKENGDEAITGVKGSCLEALLAACHTRSFDIDGTVFALEQAAIALDRWLHAETTFRMWLPTLGLDAKLTVNRIEFLFILGNHVKHNLARLTRISRQIAELLKRNGYIVELEQIPLALDDFREHLQEDYFVYYGTWLAELTNNVRWGIQDYLMPTFQRAYRPGADLMYSYNYPDSIVHDTPRAWFWRLMNHIRSGPYIERFIGSRYMKREILRDRV
jgi:hypothetical protein